MEKSGQQPNKPQPYFIDKWCARHIRKVVDCHLCLHFNECRSQRASVAPAAIEHKVSKSKVKTYDYFDDVNVVEGEDD